MALVKKLPLEFISFPNNCIKCGKPFEKEGTITAEKGIDLILYKSWTDVDIPVPLCKSCHMKRKVAGFITLPLAVMLTVLIIVLVAMFDEYISETLLLLLVFFPSLYILYFARNKLDPMLDKSFLGLKAVSLYTDTGEVELWFADGKLACDVEAITLKNMNESRMASDPEEIPVME